MKLMTQALLFAFVFCCSIVVTCLADEASVLVKTVAVKRERLTTTITSYGMVAVDPRQTFTISFPRPGEISSLLVSEGQVVQEGTPLLNFVADPANTQTFRQAVTALEFARSELRRTERMVSQQMATQSQLDLARKGVADAEAVFDAQRGLGMERSTECKRAPFTGIVTGLSVREGDRVQAGTPLVRLAKRGALRVELGVEPEDSLGIKVGMPVRLVSVFDARQTFSGIVSEVHGVIDPQTRLVDIIVRISRGLGERLIPGTRVRGGITITAATSWVVPRSAILRDNQGGYLYQIDRGRARRIRVTTGSESNGMIGVRGQIDPRLKVVVLGNYELNEGMAVREAGQ